MKQDNPVFHQEISGPVAVVRKLASEHGTVEPVDDSALCLGGSVFSGDLARAEKVAEPGETGTMCVNTATAAAPELLSGRIRNSGSGRELSFLGIEAFISRKLIRVG